jgi:diguanylate cyclase (GGDEF)-like protein
VALRRRIQSAPIRVVIALPEASVPAGAVASIFFASLLIAALAGLVAFAVGERRLRPLDELTDGARRLASGESGVRVQLDSAHGEVRLLGRSFNEMAGQLEAQRRALEERNVELLRANEVLEQLSITDGLTHLHNHRHFHDQFVREVKRADRGNQPLCLMLIDIDDFKVLNDTYGHAAGDMVLAAAAQLMNSQVRESDYLARYGGEEFAMLLPQTRLEGAVALAEKIRGALAQHTFMLPEGGEGLRVTVSIGVAEHATTVDETFDAADRALYEAKGAGKDCVIAAPLMDRPSPSARRRR